MSKIQGIFLLTIMLGLLVLPNAKVQPTAKPFDVTSSTKQRLSKPADWCCLAGLACCIPTSE